MTIDLPTCPERDRSLPIPIGLPMPAEPARRQPHGPALPWPGLLSVLSNYSSRGQLFTALGTVPDDDAWSSSDVRRRARRILLERLIPTVRALPTSTSAWLDALPAESRRHRATTTVPVGRIDWPRTRLGGWPPTRFVTSRRSRTPDEVLVTTLAWAGGRVLDVVKDATSLLPGGGDPIAVQLETLRRLLDVRPLVDAEPVAPGRPELAALRATGRPWSALASMIDVLRLEDLDLPALARELLVPDDDLRWRLFHLGCLGTVLTALKGRGWTATGLRPLGIGTGPAYALTDDVGRQWELWFEAAGIWSYYKVSSPYAEASAGLAAAAQPLGADIALFRGNEEAVAIECKYSADPKYIVRNGYLQGMAYLSEIRSRKASTCRAIVVGPEDVVPSTHSTSTIAGELYIAPPSALPQLLP